MEHNPQLYDKIQELYEKYWEIKSRPHDDSDYFPIIESLEDILYRNPDNEYALQLKIIVKRSYKCPPIEELKALSEHICRINPNNQFAIGPKKLKYNSMKFLYKFLRIIAIAGFICSIIVIILILSIGY